MKVKSDRWLIRRLEQLMGWCNTLVRAWAQFKWRIACSRFKYTNNIWGQLEKGSHLCSTALFMCSFCHLCDGTNVALVISFRLIGLDYRARQATKAAAELAGKRTQFDTPNSTWHVYWWSNHSLKYTICYLYCLFGCNMKSVLPPFPIFFSEPCSPVSNYFRKGIVNHFNQFFPKLEAI